MLKFVSAASKLQSDLMKTDDDADDEFVPGDTTGWNIVSHPSVFADVFHWRHEEDHDCENASTQESVLSDWTIKKGTLGVTD